MADVWPLTYSAYLACIYIPQSLNIVFIQIMLILINVLQYKGVAAQVMDRCIIESTEGCTCTIEYNYEFLDDMHIQQNEQRNAM